MKDLTFEFIVDFIIFLSHYFIIFFLEENLLTGRKKGLNICIYEIGTKLFQFQF